HKRITPGRKPCARLRDHRFADIYADDFSRRIVVVERQPGANADFEDAAADLPGRGRSATPPALENRSTNHVIDRSPPLVCELHDVAIRISELRIDHRGPPELVPRHALFGTFAVFLETNVHRSQIDCHKLWVIAKRYALLSGRLRLRFRNGGFRFNLVDARRPGDD